MKSWLSITLSLFALAQPSYANAETSASLACGVFVGKGEPLNRAAYVAKMTADVNANSYKVRRKTDAVVEEINGIKSRDGTIKFIGSGFNAKQPSRRWTFDLVAQSDKRPLVATGQMLASNGETLRDCTLTIDAAESVAAMVVHLKQPATVSTKAELSKPAATHSPQSPNPTPENPGLRDSLAATTTTATTASSPAKVGESVGQFIQGIAAGIRADGAASPIDAMLNATEKRSATTNVRQAQTRASSDVVGTLPQAPSASELAVTNDTPVGRYRSMLALLDAAKNGELLGYRNMRDEGGERSEVASVLNSIAAILATEYGTPVPDWQQRNRYAGGNSPIYCSISGVKDSMHRLLRHVTEAHTATISDKPPEFRKHVFQTDSAEYRKKVEEGLRQLRDHCYERVLGQKRPNPFIGNFETILAKYSAATGDGIEQRRMILVKRYEAQQELARVEAERTAKDSRVRESERKAKSQQQLDADRARIEAEQQERERRNKARVVG